MRPRSFGRKPLSSVLKLRRTTRPNGVVPFVARMFSGSIREKVSQIGDYVVQQLPYDSRIGELAKNKLARDKIFQKTLFRARADNSLKKITPVSQFHCADRCNLAIALLNESGIKSWLARVIYPVEESWRFHDYVEYFDKGKINTLMFVHTEGVPDSFIGFEHPVEKMFPHKTPFFFRGADSKQIGGVGNWKEFIKFANRVKGNPSAQNAKNRRRIELLVKEGIIPKEALSQIGF